MSYKLPRSDIRFLTVAYKIGDFLGIIPSYDFEKEAITHPLRDRIQAILLSCSLTAGTIYSIYRRDQEFTKKIYPIPQVIVDYINEFLLVVLAYWLILGSTIYNHEKFVKLNNDFKEMGRKLRDSDNQSCNFLRNAYVELITWQILFCIYLFYNLYTWIFLGIGWVGLEAYCVHDICYYYGFYMNFIICNIVQAFQSKYRDLNSLLKTKFSTKSSSPFVTEIKTGTTDFIRGIGSESRALGEMVDLFNQIFGWPLVFLFGKTVVQLLTSLNLIIIDLNYADESFKNGLLLANVISALLVLCSTIVIVAACDAVVDEYKQTALLCQQLQDNFPPDSSERLELLRLAGDVKTCGVKFSAANFFRIDRSTLLGILGTTTTYFIVVLQFNGACGKH